ncbi:hypothetical protein [Flavobacterium hercynium]|uniref:SMI1/KNR4 family protein n=2 Tax=Flavobacterium hercynium TaxID=387094 RepID=A0A226HHQ1_9FLAO|nr:hypothetical protein [Flavobacterium hercynium]OXA93879.1 hypothetical protein B0A66_06355 [Flavobacterium hercynium]SMP20799.1 hypothetical protein SAMN06265346_106236 [Flavobacterium hercynium]
MTDFTAIKQLFDITQNNGFSNEEIATYQNVCDSIPQVLYDYYLQLGKITALNQTQDRLIEPQKLQLSKDENFLIFYVENQWSCVWGIHKNDLQSNNPAVYMSYDENEWNKETDSLTDFLKAIAHLQGIFALPFNSEEFAYINNEELKIIETNFNKRDFSFSQWIGVHFYGNHPEEVIAVLKNDDYYDLIYASNNKQQFTDLHKILGELGE